MNKFVLFFLPVLAFAQTAINGVNANIGPLLFAGGTITANTLVCQSGTTWITSPISGTNCATPTVAITPATSGNYFNSLNVTGTVVQIYADNAITNNDYLGYGVATGGYALDLGSSLSNIPSTTRIIGQAIANASSGALASVSLQGQYGEMPVILLQTPTFTATPNASGGTFTAGTYYYEIQGYDGVNFTTMSPEVSVTVVANGTVSIVMSNIPSSAYRIWRGTSAGAENFYFTSFSVNFTDTGAAGTSGTPNILGMALGLKVSTYATGGFRSPQILSNGPSGGLSIDSGTGQPLGIEMVNGSTVFFGGNISFSGNSYVDSYVSNTMKMTKYATAANCSSAASPAVCGSAAGGSAVIAASATSVVVGTTAVTANSQIQLTFDSSLGTKLAATCNTTFVQLYVTARTAGISFTVTVVTAPTTNPACFSYSILN